MDVFGKCVHRGTCCRLLGMACDNGLQDARRDDGGYGNVQNMRLDDNDYLIVTETAAKYIPSLEPVVARGRRKRQRGRSSSLEGTETTRATSRNKKQGKERVAHMLNSM